jgi:phage terminase small subunit
MSALAELPQKQQRFVEEYLIDLNATQAAMRAGYSPKNPNAAGVTGHDLLRNPKIEAAIAELRLEQTERCKVTADEVISELKAMAFTNMMDFMGITSDGDPYVDLSALTRAKAAGLVDFSVDDFMDGRGEDARQVKRIRIKIGDKKGPLIELGKHLGLFRGEGNASSSVEDAARLAANSVQHRHEQLVAIADRFRSSVQALPKPAPKQEKAKGKAKAA